MHDPRRPFAPARLVAAVAGGLGAAIPLAAGEAAAKPKASVAVASTARLAPDRLAVTVRVTASCARHWQALEAFVTVSQPQTFGMGGIGLSCTGREQTFAVEVPSADVAFQPGQAQASGFVLIERRGRIGQAQDTGAIQLR
jgi:hypothetical protein